MQGTLKVVSKHQVSASRSLLNHLFSEFPFFPSLDCCCHLLFFQRPHLLFSFRMLCPYCGLCFLCLSDSVSILQGFVAKPLGFSVCLSAFSPPHIVTSSVMHCSFGDVFFSAEGIYNLNSLLFPLLTLQTTAPISPLWVSGEAAFVGVCSTCLDNRGPHCPLLPSITCIPCFCLLLLSQLPSAPTAAA